MGWGFGLPEKRRELNIHMKRVNYHTHTQYCRHAAGKAEDYAEAARREGLSILGFSDHMPFPGAPFGYRMKYEEIQCYFEDIQKIREASQKPDEASGKLQVFCGFEGEYIRGKEAYYESLLSGKNCDYLILGQHMYLDQKGTLCTSGNMNGTEEYKNYFDSLVEGMKTGCFRLIAHPDFVFINPFSWDIHCERACDRFFEQAVSGDYILEYNANGYRRGLHPFEDGTRLQYPHEKFWKKAAQSNLRVVVGSDCHEPSQMYDSYVKKAYEDARGLSLNLITDIF